MGSIWKENWKRTANTLPNSNISTDDTDIVRFRDLDRKRVLSGDDTIFTLTSQDDVALVNSSGVGGKTVNLPATSGNKRIYIKDKFGDAGTNSISIIPFNTDTIDGAGSGIIDNNYGSLTLYFDEGEWSIL